MDGQDPNSSYIEQSNCDAKLSTGDTICGTRMMACRETSRNGEIECSSFCSGKLSKIMRHNDASWNPWLMDHEQFLNVKSAENVVEACGTNGLCSQPVSGNDQKHVCSCDSGTWWTTGGDFGESRDPCKPVLENWLIIVIGILGFLLLILIIIGKSFNYVLSERPYFLFQSYVSNLLSPKTYFQLLYTVASMVVNVLAKAVAPVVTRKTIPNFNMKLKMVRLLLELAMMLLSMKMIMHHIMVRRDHFTKNISRKINSQKILLFGMKIILQRNCIVPKM